MTTHELLVIFVETGGVITLHNSGNTGKPIQFSIRYAGREWVGRTSNLNSVLSEILEPLLDDWEDLAEWHPAFNHLHK